MVPPPPPPFIAAVVSTADDEVDDEDDVIVCDAQLLLDWKLALRDTQGEGRSDPPDSELELPLVDEVSPPDTEDPRESIDHVEDMSSDLGREDFIRMRLSRVDTR